jgi:HEAT repeat protein
MEMKDYTKHRGYKLVIPLVFCLIIFINGCGTTKPGKTYDVAQGSCIKYQSQAMEIIRHGLVSDEPRIRANSIEVVGNQNIREYMPVVLEHLKDNIVPVRFAACVAIGDAKYTSAREKIKNLTNDQNENVRIAANYALNRIQGTRDYALLGKAIASKDQTVRANAAFLLGKTNDLSVLELLYWVKNHEDSDVKVRLEATEAIARLGDRKIYPKIWTMLISKYIENKLSGIRALGYLGSGEAKNALLTMLQDETLEIRIAAAGELGKMGDFAGEKIVADALNSDLSLQFNSEEIERIQVITSVAIGQIKSASLARYLPMLLQEKSEYVKIAASQAVLNCIKAKD